VQTIDVLIRTPPALFLAGIVALIAGLAMVLGHNVWSGGALPATVTVVGWVTLLRGLAALWLPPDAEAGIFAAFQFDRLFYMYVGVALALGIYLTYGGFSVGTRWSGSRTSDRSL
jgi:hypothetical protein